VVFRDRTSEQALENAKDDFVSLASHQLRTPATATKQFLAMFLEGYAGKIDDRQRMFLQQAYDNNELGIAIIEDLLNATRLESNRLKVVKEKIELTHFLKMTADQHKPLAERNGQTIKVVVPHKHVYIESDDSLLGMAVDNLVTNALKYSPEDSTVTIRLTDGPYVTIEVSDTGIGIQKSDISKIFERFSRLEDPQKQHVSGTGIGLYLVRRIVQVLHAKIKVESIYGKGSTFILKFKSVR
jgi:two-component system phosphate regulon sensor histidine kinase PhoR